ncbi:MAG: c-type cytochrome [Burkholderiales bacterium]|nr:c-type cytochrome [Burkholderiales bacterium]
MSKITPQVNGAQLFTKHSFKGEMTATRPSPVFVASLSLALVAMTSLALADGAAITQHGNTRRALACMTCHGAQGEGTPTSGFPRLAGLNAGYLRTQLDNFAQGRRVNAIMAPIALALNDDEREAVTRYYAGLRGAASTAKPVPQTNVPGASLANQGRWSQGLPACIQCHGAMGVGVGSTFPALAGQSSIYLENQLRAWQEGTRAPGPLGLMKGVADKMSAADIKAVAAYFSALPPSQSTLGSKP